MSWRNSIRKNFFTQGALNLSATKLKMHLPKNSAQLIMNGTGEKKISPKIFFEPIFFCQSIRSSM
ncbi:MAG: hypothetical protein IJS69_05900, partial [Selenomonadaceae bacterium]|nr:hypothetical protein [Selenomonadaceae bacterium]